MDMLKRVWFLYFFIDDNELAFLCYLLTDIFYISFYFDSYLLFTRYISKYKTIRSGLGSPQHLNWFLKLYQ